VITLRKLAKTYSGLGKHKKAIEILLDAVDEDKRDVYTYLELGKVYLAMDSLSPAELYITKAREIDKTIPDAYIALGDLYFARKIYELAKMNYEEALSIDTNIVEAREKLATAYYWLGMREVEKDLANELFARSLKEWNTVTKQNPKNAKAFFQQGKILFFSKRFGHAASSFYKYMAMRPDDMLAKWYLAQSFYEIRECDSAAPFLRECANEIDSVKTKSLLLLARCYFDSKNYAKSSEVFAELRSLDKLNTTDLQRFAGAALIEKDTVLAIENYKEALEINPKLCKLSYKLGKLLYVLKRYEESIEIFDLRIANCEKDNFSAKSWFYKGLDYMKLDKYEESINSFDQTMELDSTYIKALIYKADIYAKKGILDTALMIFTDVKQKAIVDTIKFGWESKTVFFKIAGMQIKDKKYSDLLKLTKEWTDLYPGVKHAWLYRAYAFQGSQNLESAMAMYRKVLAIDPKNKTAKTNLSKLKEIQSQKSGK
ncbi:MAG: hypothetical protein KAH48_08870, partial [Chlorobi bacterium]|nr:hypothetical protein [Chlorobiota bacterium]